MAHPLPIIPIFAVVFALNVMPAFAPPTWMTLSFLGLMTPGMGVAPLALVGATAATLGRLTLAKFSRVIIRQNILSEPTRQNVDAIRRGIENRRELTFGRRYVWRSLSVLFASDTFSRESKEFKIPQQKRTRGDVKHGHP